jgi:hypothetical protein
MSSRSGQTPEDAGDLSSGKNGNLVALEMWDNEALHLLAARRVQAARDTGALVQRKA